MDSISAYPHIQYSTSRNAPLSHSWPPERQWLLMKAFRMPDIIAVALICSLPVAFIILVVWPLVQDDEWRLVIWATSSILQAILTFAWSTIASRFRVPVYRWYYRVFGPRCDVRVSATMQVNPYHSNKQLMDTALDLARKWNGEAHERVRIPAAA